MNAKKLVPLSGIAAVGLVIASFMIIGETPDIDAPVNEITSFWTKHDSDGQFGGFLIALGALFFLFFATNIAGALRRAQGETGGSSALSFGGGIIFAVGLLVFAGINFTLGDLGGDGSPDTLQALNALGEDFFFPLAMGAAAFGIGTGIAITKTGVLPRWFGWVAVVIGVVSATPAGFFGFMLLGLWIIAASVMLSIKAE
jgi:hypothetical protein